jgi:hypothetical protein
VKLADAGKIKTTGNMVEKGAPPEMLRSVHKSIFLVVEIIHPEISE